jgi:hypothetical protein
MTRVLMAARVRVSETARQEWLGMAGKLSRSYAARGQHVWVFRHPRDRELHMEFREAPSRELLAPAGAEEAALDSRLAALGTYEHTDIVWESVTLPEGD